MFPSKSINLEELPMGVINFIPLNAYPKGVDKVENYDHDENESNILTGFVFTTIDYIGVVIQFVIPPNSKSFTSDKYDRSYPFSVCLISENPNISRHFQFLSDLVTSITKEDSLPTVFIEAPESFFHLKGSTIPNLTINEDYPYFAIAPKLETPSSFIINQIKSYYEIETMSQIQYPVYRRRLLYPTVQMLLTSLSPEDIVKLYLIILCEYKIVFKSKDLTKLSFCVIAATNMMSKLKVQSTVNPVIPDSENFYGLFLTVGGPIFGFVNDCTFTGYLVDLDKEVAENESRITFQLDPNDDDDNQNYDYKKELKIPYFSYEQDMVRKIKELIIKAESNTNENDLENELIYPRCFKHFIKTKSNFILTNSIINNFSNALTQPLVSDLKPKIWLSRIIHRDEKGIEISVQNKNVILGLDNSEFMKKFINTVMYQEFTQDILKEISSSDKLEIMFFKPKKRHSSTSDLSKLKPRPFK